ncbi:hypothetical protein, conserved [Eimeria necatrix]|uniref:Uncharacterized protein n=1 Tax=Eimeria necatrix TaxID=51315 RepID=U6MVH4_9EIME|nr:hypothetical protein, conserved [Eimeria necatrix]CDJ65690.1 hypothetical protein, conserved [Eimeria necatrix]
MKDEETPPTAAERAAATMAAAAEAAAAEAAAAAAEAEDSERTALLAADVQRAAEPWESSAEGEPEALAAYGMGERKGRQPRTPSPAPMIRSLAAAPAPAKNSVENHAAEDSFLDDVSSFGKAPSRSCQWLRCLPVLFLMLLVLYINLVYVAFHCLPQLQIGRPPALRDARRFQK